MHFLPVKNSVNIARMIMKNVVPEGASVLDATCGNGRDTAFLADLVGPAGHVWAFDIQPQAIEKTRESLKNLGLEERVSLIQACHSKIGDYVPDQVFAAMFNLGYLPGGDHSLKTGASTTLMALSAMQNLLARGGVMSIVAYPGHPGGEDEYEAVKHYLSSWPQQDFEVLEFSFLNQVNQPAILLLVHKL